MTTEGAFTAAAFEALLPAVYVMDDESKQTIFEFVRDKCASRPGFMQLMVVLAEMCAATLRRINEREGNDFDFMSLHFSEHTPREARTFGQIITVTINGDGDTQVALLRSLLDRGEKSDDGYEISFVVAHCFGLFSFLLHELADPDSQNTEEVDRG